MPGPAPRAAVPPWRRLRRKEHRCQLCHFFPGAASSGCRQGEWVRAARSGRGRGAALRSLTSSERFDLHPQTPARPFRPGCCSHFQLGRTGIFWGKETSGQGRGIVLDEALSAPTPFTTADRSTRTVRRPGQPSQGPCQAPSPRPADYANNGQEARAARAARAASTTTASVDGPSLN